MMNNGATPTWQRRSGCLCLFCSGMMCHCQCELQPNSNLSHVDLLCDLSASIKGEKKFFSPLFLSVQVLYPSGSFGIVYLAQVSLGGRQICMAQYDFAHNFKWSAGPGGIGRGMPPQIMGA